MGLADQNPKTEPIFYFFSAAASDKIHLATVVTSYRSIAQDLLTHDQHEQQILDVDSDELFRVSIGYVFHFTCSGSSVE